MASKGPRFTSKATVGPERATLRRASEGVSWGPVSAEASKPPHSPGAYSPALHAWLAARARGEDVADLPYAEDFRHAVRWLRQFNEAGYDLLVDLYLGPNPTPELAEGWIRTAKGDPETTDGWLEAAVRLDRLEAAQKFLCIWVHRERVEREQRRRAAETVCPRCGRPLTPRHSHEDGV